MLNKIAIQGSIFIVAFMLAALYAMDANADVLVLNEGRMKYSLGKHLEIYIDDTKNLTINEIRSPEFSRQFKISNVDTPSFGQTDSAVWSRVTLHNPTENTQTWFLELARFNIQDISLFIIDPILGISERSGGGHRPFNQREIKYHHTTFEIKIIPKNKITLYLRTWGEISHSIPLKLWSPKAFTGKAVTESYALGIFYGVFMVMILYNLFVYFSVIDHSYLYYVLYLLSAVLYMAGVDGLVSEYLMPNQPWLVYRGALFFSSLAAAAATFFCQSFVQSKKYLPKFNIFLTALGLFFLSVSILPFVLSLSFSTKFITRVNLFTPVILLAVGLISWRKGFSGARFFVFAWTINIISIIVHTSKLVGLLPDVFITRNALRIGFTTEMILLSLALADRINIMRQEIINAQSQKLQTQQAFTKELEEKVLERTKELRQANEELDRLSNIDGLSQLFNRRYFDERINNEWERLKRMQQPLAMIMCDIDYFKKYNDSYGHPRGDDCLQKVADVIKKNTRRAGDVAARYGGEEFVILLPHCTVEEAKNVAEAIRSGVENLRIPHQASPIKNIVSISLGISAVVPDKSTDPSSLISMADKALYDSKLAGRDRVSVKY